MSYLSLGEADKAEADLVTAARLEPGNRAVQVCNQSSVLIFSILHSSLLQEQLGLVRRRRRNGDKEMANKLGKMFS